MPSIIADLVCHGSVHSLCGYMLFNRGAVLLTVVTSLQPFYDKVHLNREHVYFLNSVHPSLARLESLIAPSLVGEHLLDEVTFLVSH